MNAKGTLTIVNHALTGPPPGSAKWRKVERAAERRGQVQNAPAPMGDEEAARRVEQAIVHAPTWLRGVPGPMLWAALHRRALAQGKREADAAWLAGFRQILPCGECRQHWDGMLTATPPVWGEYFAWTVARHNEVNRRLRKAEMGLEQALQRWRTGVAAAVQKTG
jgi:hypothetical protein